MIKWFCVCFLSVPVLLSVAFLPFLTVPGPLKLRRGSNVVSIERDQNLIPYIKALELEDAIYGVGYAMSQDRLWQIDITRRLATGRLSEILGDKGLDIDVYIRNIKIPRQAAKDVLKYSKEGKRLVEAFIKGINDAARAQYTPIEYYLTWSAWEDFTAVDYQSIVYINALVLTNSWGNDVLRYQLLNLIGKEAYYLIPSDYYLIRPLSFIISDEELDDSLKGNNNAYDPKDFNEPIDVDINFEDLGAGSNGWVISGKYTKSGKPILSNDPHLSSSIPSLWYLAHISWADKKFSGCLSIGNSLIVSGRSNNFTWGLTSMKADNIDIFIEKIIGDQYLYDNQLKDFTYFKENILVRGEGVKTFNFKETIHGPILSNSFIGANKIASTLTDTEQSDLSFCWSVYEFIDESVEASLKMFNAQSMDDIREALSYVTSVGLGFLVGSVFDDIYFQTTGRIPIRNGLGDMPLKGWLKENSWTGYIPYEEMPYLINPDKGYIVMANNYPVGQSYKYFNHIGRYFSQGRADRINELIKESIDLGVKFTSGHQLIIQRDELNVFAREAVPVFVKMVKKTEEYSLEYDLIKNWDFVMSKDSVPAALYAVWIKNIATNLLIHKVPTKVLNSYLSSLLMQLNVHMYFQDYYPSLSKLCDDPISIVKETCEDLVTKSFIEACKYVDKRMWGDIHHVTLEHTPFSKVRGLSWFFDRKQRAGGMYTTVHSAHYPWSKDFNCNFGPGMRMIIDLGNSSDNYWALQSGQSGNPFSKHYDDMFAGYHYGNIINWQY